MSNKLRRSWLGIKNHLKRDKPTWVIVAEGKRYRHKLNSNRRWKRRENFPQFDGGEYKRFVTYGRWFYGRDTLILHGGTNRKWAVRARFKSSAIWLGTTRTNKLVRMRWWRETNS